MKNVPRSGYTIGWEVENVVRFYASGWELSCAEGAGCLLFQKRRYIRRRYDSGRRHLFEMMGVGAIVIGGRT